MNQWRVQVTTCGWWDADGNLLLSAVERVELENQRAEQERQQKERLIAYLLSQGIDPNNLPPE